MSKSNLKIVVFPPCERLTSKNIGRTDKYIAVKNVPESSIGYGTNLTEAIDNLKSLLHDELDQIPIVKENNIKELRKDINELPIFLYKGNDELEAI